MSILFGPFLIADKDSNKKLKLHYKSNFNPLYNILQNRESKKILKNNQIKCNFFKELLEIVDAFYNELLCFEEFSDC